MRGRRLLTGSVVLLAAAGLGLAGGPIASGVPSVPVTAAASAAADYRFVLVADAVRDDFEDIGCAVINDSGQIAFQAGSHPGNGYHGVYRVDPGRPGMVTIARGPEQIDAVPVRSPSINSLGQVAFQADLPNGRGQAVLRGDGGPLTTIARSTRGPWTGLDSQLSMNDAGRVAFHAVRVDTERDAWLLSGDGGPLTTVYRTSTSRFENDDPFLVRPGINNRGAIAFVQDVAAGTGIFVARPGEGVVTRIGPTTQYRFSPPELNNRGEVAFFRVPEATGARPLALLTGLRQPFREIVNSRIVQTSYPPTLNDRSQVAYTATPRGQRGAVMVGSDPEPLIGYGDTYGGREVFGASICPGGLNNSGQLAVSVTVLDPGGPHGYYRQLVLRADPVVAPQAGGTAR